MIDSPILGFFKLNTRAPDPSVGTRNSACFDISAFFNANDPIKYMSKNNTAQEITGLVNMEGKREFHLQPGHRYMTPTGLIFDIPVGYSIRLHPRSGLSLKYGLGLSNMTGVIDSDYVDELFILLENRSGQAVTIVDGMRICQAELIKDLNYDIVLTDVRPSQKTDRSGGFGSTGQ